jgi:hypothetical protein
MKHSQYKTNMKTLIKIKFNENLIFDNNNNSYLIHNFIFEELNSSRELLFLKKFTSLDDILFEQLDDNIETHLMLQIIIDLPETLYENYNKEKIFNYIRESLDTLHIRFLNDSSYSNQQHVVIDMNKDNPNLNFDYSALDL